MAAAREPLPAARVLDDKLANWSGGRRYTCPSYEVVRVSDGVRIAVPGFQPFAVYDPTNGFAVGARFANLVPGVDRRDPPESVEEILRWTGTPLATKRSLWWRTSRSRTRASGSVAWPSSVTRGSTGSGRCRTPRKGGQILRCHTRFRCAALEDLTPYPERPSAPSSSPAWPTTASAPARCRAS